MDRAYSLIPNPLYFDLSPLRHYARSIGLAVLATALLLLMMSQLIATQYVEPVDDPPPRIPNIHLEPKTPTPAEQQAPTRPESPPPVTINPVEPRVVEPTTITTVIAPPTVDKGRGGPEPISSDPIPFYKPAPRYPSVALRRGIEGYVVVEFSINETGAVMNPRVVGGYDSAGNATDVFDRAALSAVARFKYRPQLEEGVPVVRHGVRNRISFNIAE